MLRLLQIVVILQGGGALFLIGWIVNSQLDRGVRDQNAQIIIPALWAIALVVLFTGLVLGLLEWLHRPRTQSSDQ